MDPELMFDVIEQQAQEGVDFMTIHCGVNQETVSMMDRQPRLMGVVSRGGSFLVKWIKANKKENPYYEQYDRLLKIAQNADADIAICELKRVYSYENKKITQKNCLQNYTTNEAVRRLFFKREVRYKLNYIRFLKNFVI